MIVTFFGSCSREYLDRAPVSFLVEDGDDNLLVDCGSGIISGMKKANKCAGDINNVLLTHVHGDHIGSISYFAGFYRKWDKSFSDSPKPLNIYGPKDTLEIARFDISHMYPKALENINFLEISPSSSFKCGSLNVKIFNAIHTVPCVGCIIESNGKKLVYSSDSLPCNDIIENANNADLLIHEGMLLSKDEEFAKKIKHSTAKWAGEVATKVNAKALALVHINLDVFGKESQLVEETREKYSGLITIPVEGTVFNI